MGAVIFGCMTHQWDCVAVQMLLQRARQEGGDKIEEGAERAAAKILTSTELRAAAKRRRRARQHQVSVELLLSCTSAAHDSVATRVLINSSRQIGWHSDPVHLWHGPYLASYQCWQVGLDYVPCNPATHPTAWVWICSSLGHSQTPDRHTCLPVSVRSSADLNQSSSKPCALGCCRSCSQTHRFPEQERMWMCCTILTSQP